MVRLNWSKLYAHHPSPWVGLSLLCVTTTLALFKLSMPCWNTKVCVCVRKICHSRLPGIFSIFLCQNGVLNQAILAHFAGTFAFLSAIVQV